MQIVLIPTMVLVLCGIGLFLMVTDYREHETSYSMEQSMIRPMLIYAGIMIGLTIAISVVFAVYHTHLDIFTKLKRMILLCVIWPLAYIDLKTYRIPNAFIVFGLACRAVLLPFEIMFNPYLRIDIVSELIAAGALLLAAVLCVVCLHGAIGAGDMKLFIVMGLLLGLEAIWSTIFMSLLISFGMALYLLITKKKNKKDAIPFGPAIVLGTYLSLCLMGG